MSDPSREINQRRGFLKHAVAAGTGLASLSAPAAAVPAAPPAAEPMRGYLCFSQDEAAFVETLVTIMCPADELTPNGVDCGLATYIDRQLAGDFGRGAGRYVHGPWQPGLPQQGYQLPMTPQQYFKAGVEAANRACRAKFGNPYDMIPPTDASAFLTDLAEGKIESPPDLPLAAWFDDLIYPLFEQACFADPIYGGNRDKVFWKMIGYPGLPATHSVNMVQFRGKPFPGARDPKSIADFS